MNLLLQPNGLWNLDAILVGSMILMTLALMWPAYPASRRPNRRSPP